MADPTGGTVPPALTVGIFGYNHRRFIREALESTLDSTFSDIEVWVVDDGSGDRTAEVVAETLRQRPDPRVRVLADDRNVGLAARINDVIGRARGEWLAILGGDDAYLPDGLAILMGAVEPRADVIWGDLVVVDERGRPLGYRRPADTWQGPAARRYRRPAPPVADIYRYNNFISGTSSIVRISALRAVGGYRVGARTEDLDMWLRLGPDHGFKYVAAAVARYRVVPGSSSRSEATALRDQAEMVGHLRADHRQSEQGLARLLAMRWALAVGRTRGRPPLSLGELARVSGLPPRMLRRSVPRAVLDPPLGSAVAGIRRLRPDRKTQGAP